MSWESLNKNSLKFELNSKKSHPDYNRTRYCVFCIASCPTATDATASWDRNRNSQPNWVWEVWPERESRPYFGWWGCRWTFFLSSIFKKIKMSYLFIIIVKTAYFIGKKSKSFSNRNSNPIFQLTWPCFPSAAYPFGLPESAIWRLGLRSPDWSCWISYHRKRARSVV